MSHINPRRHTCTFTYKSFHNYTAFQSPRVDIVHGIGLTILIQIHPVRILPRRLKKINAPAGGVDAQRIPLHKPSRLGVVGAGAVVHQVQRVVVEDVQLAAGKGVGVGVERGRVLDIIGRKPQAVGAYADDHGRAVGVPSAMLGTGSLVAFEDSAGVIQQGDGAGQVVVTVVEVARAVVHHQHLVNIVAEHKHPSVRLHAAGSERLYRHPLVVVIIPRCRTRYRIHLFNPSA